MAHAASDPPPEDEARNVVLLCLDTVRKDYFDAFAPRIRERADVQYAGCRAASAWSTPSHASMFSGRLPHDHGVHTYAPSFTGLDRSATLLGDLPDHRAVGVSANVYAGSAYGFDGLFDDFADVTRYRRYPDALDPVAFVDEHAGEGLATYRALARAVAAHDHPARSLANVAAHRANDLVRHGPLGALPELFDDGARVAGRAARSRLDSEPFFLFVNVMDAHEPHRRVRGYDGPGGVPRGWSSESLDPADVVGDVPGRMTDVRRYRALYGASIDYLDRWTVDFVDRLQDATDRETTVVVTADHGENLAYTDDERLFGHIGSLSEGLLHVPLCVLNAPENLGTVEGSVSHLDLGRLLVGLARGETPDVVRDRAAAELVGRTPSNDALTGERWDRARRCVYEDDRKWVWDDAGTVRAYDLDPARPCEQTPVEGDATVPDWASEFFTTEPDLAAFRERARARADERDADPLDADVHRRLADLGYR
ncbi:sulfatase-like hydrolase/transferase [Halomarina ordinaria]|uniref:Sulfatase-like hydrolase/transferase n=1 Tax=Halomarina ordinaria TaxID=3033939 RepID=A0ABD5UDA4_9EURY|nr:sulfatase-like hydrolase/transferase [Halomarina sp. PSRA2]